MKHFTKLAANLRVWYSLQLFRLEKRRAQSEQKRWAQIVRMIESGVFVPEEVEGRSAEEFYDMAVRKSEGRP